MLKKNTPKSSVKLASAKKNPQPQKQRMLPSTSQVTQTCGLVDPFCEHARGAKYPDESSSRTLPFSFNFSKTFSTDAVGSLGFTFFPRIANDGSGQINVATMSSYNVATSNVNFATADVPVLANMNRYRVVSCGVRVKRISSPLTTTGMLYIRSYAESGFGNMNVYNVDTFSASKVVNVPLIDAKDVAIINEHSSQPPQLFYQPTTNPASNFLGAGFNPISIGVVGGPLSVAVIFVEFYMHVEYIFDDAGALALAATPPPVYSSLVNTITRDVTSHATNFYHESSRLASEFIKKKIVSLFTSTLSKLPNPYLRAAGYATQVLTVD